MLYGSAKPRTAPCNTVFWIRTERRPQERRPFVEGYLWRILNDGLVRQVSRHGAFPYMMCCCSKRCIKAMSETLSTP